MLLAPILPALGIKSAALYAVEAGDVPTPREQRRGSDDPAAPTMPKSPPIHRPLGHRAEQRQRRYSNAQRLRLRGAANPYNAPWPAIRRAHLLAHPLCVFHMEQFHKRVPANEVDHIDGNPWNNDPSNHRSLCKRCHSARTAREQSFGRRVHG